MRRSGADPSAVAAAAVRRRPRLRLRSPAAAPSDGAAGRRFPARVGRAGQDGRRRPSPRPAASSLRVLGEHNLVLADTTRRRSVRPSRPLLAAAPRAVYQVILPDDPTRGFIVVYEFPDAAAPRRPRRPSSRRYLGDRSGPRPDAARDASTSSARSGRRSSSTLAARTRRRIRAAAGDPAPRSRRSASGSRSRAAAARGARAARLTPTGERRVSTAAQARTGSRLILSVWVRGKSSSGQRRQPAIRWFGPERRVGGLHRGVDPGADLGRRRRRRPPASPSPACPSRGRPPRSGRAASRARPSRGCRRSAARSRCPRDTR